MISAATATRLRGDPGHGGGGGDRPARERSGYSVGGKTGTAQKLDPVTRVYSRKPGVLSFVGFVPADEAPAGHAGAARRAQDGRRAGSQGRGPAVRGGGRAGAAVSGSPPPANQPSVPLIRTAAAVVAPAEPAIGPTAAPLFAPEHRRADDARPGRTEPAPGAGAPGRLRPGAGRRGPGLVVRQIRLPARRSRPGTSAGSTWRRRGPPGHDLPCPRPPVALDALLAVLPERTVAGPLPACGPGADRRLPARDGGRLLRGRPRSPGWTGTASSPRPSSVGPGRSSPSPRTRCRTVRWARILVPDSRRALALLAAEETGHPSRELVMVGVTGTNGKTTTTRPDRGALGAWPTGWV